MNQKKNDAHPPAGGVGEILRNRRQKQGLSLTQVELTTKIRGKFLIQLESGDYSGMANDIYTHGFVRSYANFLGLDGHRLAKQFAREHGGPPVLKPIESLRTIKPPRLVVTPKLILLAAGFLITGLVVAYLGWQLSTLAAAPKLEVISPTNDQVVFGSLVEVSGKAAPGADVLINDSPVLADANGNFSDQLALQNGLNTINISARNRLGKTTTITRSILAQVPPPEAAADFPAAVFEGIAVKVSIKDSATALVVEVDGQEVFRGTMLAGSSQIFKGAERIKITTSNAGHTSLLITNKVAANQAIDSLGREGETKRDLEFAKDTVIK